MADPGRMSDAYAALDAHELALSDFFALDNDELVEHALEAGDHVRLLPPEGFGAYIFKIIFSNRFSQWLQQKFSNFFTCL